MGKGNGSTRASSSSNPTGLSADAGLSRISDTDIRSLGDQLSREIRDAWKTDGNIEIYVNIPGQPLVASYTLEYKRFEDAWAEAVQLRSTTDSKEEVNLITSERSAERPNMFTAMESGYALRDLLRKYNGYTK